MKAYLDNNVVSAIARDDNELESDAISRLLEAREDRKVLLVTSRLTLDEIKKVPPKYLRPLERIFRILEKIPLADWDELNLITQSSSGNASVHPPAMSSITSASGGDFSMNIPVIENNPLYDQLLALGLEVIDAQHLFVAANRGCDVFLTCDNSRRTGIIRRAVEIQELLKFAVQRPSEFLATQGW